jgi:thiamine pyrophosphate-dependent acetolactate synthase large subunit-like protein
MLDELPLPLLANAVSTPSAVLMSAGLQEAEWHVTKELKDIYPDFVKMADAFGVPAKRVTHPDELRPAIR